MVVKHVKEFINITRETYHNEEKNAPFDTQTALVCVLGALSLLLIQFIAKTGNLSLSFGNWAYIQPLTILDHSLRRLKMEI